MKLKHVDRYSENIKYEREWSKIKVPRVEQKGREHGINKINSA